MKGELKVGMAGAPRSAGFMAGFNAVSETKVTAICDPNREALERVAERFGIEKRYQIYEEMLEDDIDIVVVATPMQLHVPMACQALERGKHVLSEVTAATDMDQCAWLVDAVRRTGGIYMMAENYCYMKANVLIKSLVEHGMFGEIYWAEGEYVHNCRSIHHDAQGRPTWRYYWQVGKNGCTYCTHSLGPVLDWFNERAVTVSCHGTGRHTDPDHLTDDSVLMLCKTESGALVKIRVDMISNRPHAMVYYSLQGTKGCYEAPRGFGDDHKIWLADRSKSREEWMSLWELEEEFMPEMWRNPPEEALRAGHGGGDYFEVREFVDAILGGQQPPVDVYRAMDFTVPGLISEQSIAQGGAVLAVPDLRERPWPVTERR